MDNKWNGCENDTDSKEPPRPKNDGSANFKCDVCQFATYSHVKLKLHKQNQHKQDCGQRYLCDMCKFTSLTVKQLIEHKKGKHEFKLKSALSAFSLFLKEQRITSSGRQYISSADLLSNAKEKWKILDAEDKAKYRLQAKKDFAAWHDLLNPRYSSLANLENHAGPASGYGSNQEEEGDASGVEDVDLTYEVVAAPDNSWKLHPNRGNTDGFRVDMILPASSQLSTNELNNLGNQLCYVGSTNGSSEGQSVVVSNHISTNQNSKSNHSVKQNGEAPAANESPPFLEYPQGPSQLPSSVLPASEYTLTLEHNLNEDPFLQATTTATTTEKIKQEPEKKQEIAFLYKCAQCDYCTAKRCNLDRHTKTRHDEQASVLHCDICDFVTRHSSYLNKHKKRHATKKMKVSEHQEAEVMNEKTRKRDPNAFIVFAAENRARVKEELCQDGKIPNSRDVNRELGRLWRILDESLKQEYTKPKQESADNEQEGKLPSNPFCYFMRDYYRTVKLLSQTKSYREAQAEGTKAWKSMSASDKSKYQTKYFNDRKKIVNTNSILGV